MSEKALDDHDDLVPATFTWKSFAELAEKNPECLINYDEASCSSNEGRTKLVGDSHVHTNLDMRRAFETSDGDHIPFHVTNGLFTCANGTRPIPPLLGHAKPRWKGNEENKDPNITQEFVSGLGKFLPDGESS